MPGTFPYDFDFGTTLTLPTRDDVGQGARRLDGCYVEEGEGEATFVPPKSFLSQPPLWRIDVLQDLMHDFELVRRQAIVEWAQSLAASNPLVEEAVLSRKLSPHPSFTQFCDDGRAILLIGSPGEVMREGEPMRAHKCCGPPLAGRAVCW